MDTVSLARFCGARRSQVMSAVCHSSGVSAAERTTTRTGKYVPGLTQMVSVIRLPGRLVSSIASIPSTRCRPATARVPQEIAACRDLATVASCELAAKSIPGVPDWNSEGTAATTGLQLRGPDAGARRPANAGSRAQVRVR
jgi:hypothetical protein